MTAGPSSLPSESARVLAVCDGLLREVGRRQHRFSWLRDPDGPGDGWLVVDGYYPSNRLVVHCGEDPEDRYLYEQLVPQHGLYLLMIGPEELPDDMIAAQALVRQRLEQDGWTPRPAARPSTAEPTVLTPTDQAVRTGAWTEPRRHTSEPPRHPGETRRNGAPPARRHTARTGFGIGLALIIAVLAEAYIGLIVLALNHGDVALGAGLLLDAAARAVGTLSARSPQQTWASLLIGSPSVAGQELPARAVAIAALALIALGIVLAVL